MKLLSLKLPGNIGITPPEALGNVKGGEGKLIDIIQAFVYLFFIFAIILALFVLIYSGWLWLTSAGDKQKIAAIKQRMTYALIGLIVVFLSFFIVNFVTRFFGFNLLGSIPSI